MAEIQLERLRKAYGAVEVVRDLSLTVADREFLTLVGASGCGKSTTLNLIAGLETLDSGEIRFGGRPVQGVPPERRNVAMVFQSYALYPHLSVADNLGFPLRLRKLPRRLIAQRVGEVADLLNLGPYLQRKPAELSGGQRQRVALGRALCREAEAYLLDEPLSNLDARLRVQMRAEIKRLHADLQLTMIYVTHDQAEAMTLSDRVAILDQGVLQQCAPPREIYERPVNRFVAGFFGSPAMNFCPGLLVETEAGYVVRQAAGDYLLAPERQVLARQQGPGPILLGLRPEAVTVLADGPYAGQVELVEPMGPLCWVRLRFGDWQLTASAPADFSALRGEGLRFDIAPVCHLFAADSGLALGSAAG